MLGRVVMPRVDYDAAHGLDEPCCWVCRQKWPSAFSLILDAADRELRIDGGKPIKLRPSQARALAVLINRMPRWVSRSELVDIAFSDMPDNDAPSPSSVTNAVNDCKRYLEGSRYVIQNERSGRGWRVVDEDTINREKREYEAQIPKIKKSRDMAVLSLGATKKTRGAPGKVSYRKKKDRDNPQRGLKSNPKAKISTKSALRRKKRTAADV